MKLATLNDGSRDGSLLVASRDLSRAASAADIAPSLQAALDAWDSVRPALEARSQALNAGRIDSFALDLARLAAPLPRAFGWIDSSVYLNHMELARRLRNAKVPEAYRREPLLSPRMPAPFMGPCEDVPLPAGDYGMDIEGELAVIMADVPFRSPPEQTRGLIRLVTLVNDISLRTVFAREVAEGKTSYHGKAGASMAPVAVTPDELGDAWNGGTIDLPLLCHINGNLLGRPNAAVDMSFDFPQIAAHASHSRPLPNGTVLASGTVSNRDPAAGSACIAEQRMQETIRHGEPRTAYLKPGDTLRIEMLDAKGRTVFGAIAQRVVAWPA